MEKDSGDYLHNSTTNLVILFEPGSPILTPLMPNVTESKEFQLTCESVGKFSAFFGEGVG